MVPVILTLHLIIATALVCVVLLQKSEGGALGIGGGGGGGGFLTGRGTANLLTRITAGLAAAFFATSILLTLIANHTSAPTSVFDTGKSSTSAPGAPAEGSNAPAQSGGRGILDQLQKGNTRGQVPVGR